MVMSKNVSAEQQLRKMRVRETLLRTHPEDHAHSPNWQGTHFVNQTKGHRDLSKILTWARTRQPSPWPAWQENASFPLPVTRHSENPADWRVTFINHSTVLIQMGPVNLITDPVYSQRVSPFQWAGPKRVRAPGVPLEKLPPVHIVLLSHNHYDHMDMPTLKYLSERDNPLIVTGLGNGVYMRRNGIQNIVELDWWQHHETPAGKVHFVPAQHFSGRGARDRDQALWGGLVVETSQGNLYFAGDTGDGPHFAQIGERFGAMRFSLIPIGAYEPRWFMKMAHINPAEAVKAHRETRSRCSMGIHFNTFQLTDEAITQPVVDLRVAQEEQGVALGDFVVMQEGEGRDVPLM